MSRKTSRTRKPWEDLFPDSVPIYEQAIEVRAMKPDGSLWKHRFETPVEIRGLVDDNGNPTGIILLPADYEDT
jgi:hypothetical protein